MPISRPDPATRRTAGFSLLELLVVLTIAIMLMGAALYMMGRRAPDIDRVTQVIVRELQQARMDAMRFGRDQPVLFDLPGKRMTREGKVVAGWSDPISLRLESAQSVAETFGAPGVVFFAAGGATGAVLQFRDGQQERELQLRWLTGAVQNG